MFHPWAMGIAACHGVGQQLPAECRCCATETEKARISAAIDRYVESDNADCALPPLQRDQVRSLNDMDVKLHSPDLQSPKAFHQLAGARPALHDDQASFGSVFVDLPVLPGFEMAARVSENECEREQFGSVQVSPKSDHETVARSVSRAYSRGPYVEMVFTFDDKMCTANFNAKPFGFSFKNQEVPLVISYVQPGSQSDRLGMCVGWAFLRIAGEDVTGYQWQDLLDKIQSVAAKLPIQQEPKEMPMFRF